MKNFFKPSSFKIKTALILAAYVLMGTVFLASYNTTRSKGPRELNTFDRVAIAIAYPAGFLSLPVFYVSENVFTGETTLNKIMTDSGCSNCTTDEYNKPVKQSTQLGLVTGFVAEVFFLYVLACLISLLNYYKNRRSSLSKF